MVEKILEDDQDETRMEMNVARTKRVEGQARRGDLRTAARTLEDERDEGRAEMGAARTERDEGRTNCAWLTRELEG